MDTEVREPSGPPESSLNGDLTPADDPHADHAFSTRAAAIGLGVSLLAAVVWPAQEQPVRLALSAPGRRLIWGPAAPDLVLAPDPEMRQYWWGLESQVTESGKYDLHILLEETHAGIHIPLEITVSRWASPLGEVSFALDQAS